MKICLGVVASVVLSFALAFLVLPFFYHLPDESYYFYVCCSNIILLSSTLYFCDISRNINHNMPLIILAFCAIIDSLFMFTFFKISIIGGSTYDSLAYYYCFDSLLNWDLIYTSVEIAVLIRTLINAEFVQFCVGWLNSLRSVIISKYNLHN